MGSLTYAGKETLPERFNDDTVYDVFYEPEAKMIKLYVATEGDLKIPRYIAVDDKNVFLRFDDNSFLPVTFTSERELSIECQEVIPFKKPENIDDPESIKNKILNNDDIPQSIKDKIKNRNLPDFDEWKKKFNIDLDDGFPL